MRISGNMVSNQIVQNLNIDLARLQDIHQQVSTGKRINAPSDDPLGSQRVVNLNEALACIGQYQRNAGYVTDWISASESTLNGQADVLRRANSLAVRGANDATLSQEELNAIADEVNGLLEQTMNAANTQLGGKYLFGGYQTLTPAYTATRNAAGEITAVTYAGDNGSEQVEIDSGLVVNKNVPGSQIFQPGGGTDVFATLIQLRDNLRAGNTAGVNTGISDTQAGLQQVVDQIAALGNKTTLLERATENLAAKKIGLTKLNSQLADVDMPEAIVQLQTAQNVYTAALESSGRILQQQSLMDFLS
jgi:flagellar hook-associated protein 3 FlgL